MQTITVEQKIHISYVMLHCLMKLVHLESVNAAACTIHSKIYSTWLNNIQHTTQQEGSIRYCMSQVRGKAVRVHTKITYGKMELQLHSLEPWH